MLVFQRNPLSITCEKGRALVTLSSSVQRVIAVRPWARRNLASARREDLQDRVEFWRRAARAIPVNYMTVTRVVAKGQLSGEMSVGSLPAGAVLEQTVIYDYLMTTDGWGTDPLKIAPLPALCGLALDAEPPGVKVDPNVTLDVLQDGGATGCYRGVKNTDRISYSYQIEPWPRQMGFTTPMFGPRDGGVPGNRREVELLAGVGANSCRALHNWSDQMPSHLERSDEAVRQWLGSDGRTRLAILADLCRDAGMNYTNTIDARLGGTAERVAADYDAFMELVSEHYEKIARQMAGRPFRQVSYDLIDQPYRHPPERYNQALQTLIQRLRAVDDRHLIYLQQCRPLGDFAGGPAATTGDPLTMYSFHDQTFGLTEAHSRWPTRQGDIGDICGQWWPMLAFSITEGVGLHCGSFGRFDQSTDDSQAQRILLNDFFRLFDQFGMHSHYATGRSLFQRLADGSLRPNNVVRAYRDYFARHDLNAYYE